MRNIVYIASHAGYPMDRTPLGGGAMVGLQLARHWAKADGIRLSVLGSGPEPPAAGLNYIQLPRSGDPGLVRLSELAYARFCREFEAATTQYVASRTANLDPKKTALVVNDIAESPDLEALAKLGYPIASIWHVDVVDFFNRMYLGQWIAAHQAARAFAWLDDRGLSALVPDMLRLVFDKQRRAVRHSRLVVVPSGRMAETVRRCYPGLADAEGGARTLVVPWGGWDEGGEGVELESARLREHYQLHADSRVLMTLSRISPEKGIHHLLEALALVEKSPRLAGADIVVFICGEPAFMRGDVYLRRVRSVADRLRRVRVFFPGYLSGCDKQAYFRLADLFVSPSEHESYGLTIVEALRSGLPVAASDHAGAEEILRPDYARTAAYGDPRCRAERLAEELSDLLADPEELRRMGARAREASEHMVFADAAGRLLEAVLGMISPHSRNEGTRQSPPAAGMEIS